MLFMKGSPAEPRCGFSAKVVEALQQAGVDFKHFDILSDDAVRQGLKVTNELHGDMHCCLVLLFDQTWCHTHLSYYQSQLPWLDV